MKNLIIAALGAFLVVGVVTSQEPDTKPKPAANAEKPLKYFIVKGTPKPEVIKGMVAKPVDLTPAAEGLIADIPGAKLIGYYLVVGKAQNYAIIAVPDSTDAAAITYQRMGTGLMDDMEVIEVIPSADFIPVLEKAKAMNEKDAFLKK